MTKVCVKCKKEKELEFFNKGNCKFNTRSDCKECQRKYKQNWSIQNQEHINTYAKNTQSKRRTYILTHKEQRQNTIKKFYNKHKQKIINNYKQKYKKIKSNPELLEQFRKKNRDYVCNKRKIDITFKLKNNLRCKLRKALKANIKKSKSSIELVGCTLEILKIHLESQFKTGMNWANYGNKQNQWVIDHILPCELFDLNDVNQQKFCFNYKNLQPLWKHENDNKSDILPNGKKARTLTKEEKLQYLKSLGYGF